jgi:hypothetical protein
MAGNRQRGIITLYVVIGVFLLVAGMGIALKVQTSRLASCEQESAAFKAKIRAEGEAAIAEARRITDENNARKAEYDKKIIKLRADNAALAGRLRDSAGQSSLPAARTVAGVTQPACFDRPQLDAAIRAFTSGTAAIATECQSAVDELNNAREWAARR